MATKKKTPVLMKDSANYAYAQSIISTVKDINKLSDEKIDMGKVMGLLNEYYGEEIENNKETPQTSPIDEFINGLKKKVDENDYDEWSVMDEDEEGDCGDENCPFSKCYNPHGTKNVQTDINSCTTLPPLKISNDIENGGSTMKYGDVEISKQEFSDGSSMVTITITK
jgi:hypothetical protein